MAKYRCIYDGDSFIDGIDCETFEEAKNHAEDILREWAMQTEHNYSVCDTHIGNVYAHDIKDRAKAEATLADIVATLEKDGKPVPSSLEIIDDFDMMVENCMAWVEEFDDESDEWVDIWYPSDDFCESIGFVEMVVKS